MKTVMIFSGSRDGVIDSGIRWYFKNGGVEGNRNSCNYVYCMAEYIYSPMYSTNTPKIHLALPDGSFGRWDRGKMILKRDG
jgi:hypothetical protein